MEGLVARLPPPNFFLGGGGAPYPPILWIFQFFTMSNVMVFGAGKMPMSADLADFMNFSLCQMSCFLAQVKC